MNQPQPDPWFPTDEDQAAAVARELAYSAERVVLAARIPRRLAEGLDVLVEERGGPTRAATEALVAEALEMFLLAKEGRSRPK